MLHDIKESRIEIRLSCQEKDAFIKAVKSNNDNPSTVIRGLIAQYTLATALKNKNENK